MITVPTFDVLAKLAEYFMAVPYNVTPQGLYTASSLYERLLNDDSVPIGECYDQKVYEYYLSMGKRATLEREMLGRSLHDYAIGKALDKYLAQYDRLKVVGVMGGHGMLRTESTYREIGLMSKELTERFSLMVTGGGPGAMEATHLGAWMAGRTLEEVDEALEMLKVAPSFRDEEWLRTAFQVMRRFPQNIFRSLGLPTWLYGHEPSTPFATDIAKFFDNSIREDSILTIAFGGIVFTPGSAGTMQEVFQEAVQNHYLSFGLASPMIFFGRRFWDEEMPVYPFLEDLEEKGKYKNLNLVLVDTGHDAVQELLSFRNKEGEN